jgi:hypothetical protein
MTPGEVKREVLHLDRGCVAPVIDPEAGPCYDEWGRPLPSPPVPGYILPGAMELLEMDYVRWGAHGKRHELVEDHVILCPGHHRGCGPWGGYQWATANRPAERAYLDQRGEGAPGHR